MTDGSEGARVAAPVIEHVVVLMLENRSFDHLLGFLDHPDPAFGRLVPGVHRNVAADGTDVWATAVGVPWGLDPDHSHRGGWTRS